MVRWFMVLGSVCDGSEWFTGEYCLRARLMRHDASGHGACMRTSFPLSFTTVGSRCNNVCSLKDVQKCDFCLKYQTVDWLNKCDNCGEKFCDSCVPTDIKKQCKVHEGYYHYFCSGCCCGIFTKCKLGCILHHRDRTVVLPVTPPAAYRSGSCGKNQSGEASSC